MPAKVPRQVPADSGPSAVLPAPRPADGPGMRDTQVRPWLAFLAGFVAVSAFAGAVALGTGAIDLGAQISDRLPFRSPVLGGFALALVVGLPMAVAAVRAATGRSHAGELAMLAGVLLVGWIGVQLIIIRTFSWLQPAMVAAGLAVFAAGWWLHLRSTTRS